MSVAELEKGLASAKQTKLDILFMTPNNCCLDPLYNFAAGFSSAPNHNSGPYRGVDIKAASNTPPPFTKKTAYIFYYSETM